MFVLVPVLFIKLSHPLQFNRMDGNTLCPQQDGWELVMGASKRMSSLTVLLQVKGLLGLDT